MIKEGVAVEIPAVSLGRLAERLKNWDRSVYPVVIFAQRIDDHVRISSERHAHFDGTVPSGYYVYEQFDSPEEELADYADELRRDHEDVTDERFRAEPCGCFRGRGITRRWCDEFERRAL